MYIFFKNIYRENYKFQKIKILARVACLGNEIINRLGLQKGLANHQKSRVDFILRVLKNPEIRPNAKDVYQFLERTYILGCIKMQEYDFFAYSKPNFIFLDSFSELTDQLFLNKFNGKTFLANYLDIKHNDNFNDKYINLGLLELDDLYNYYDEFLSKISIFYPNVKVIFLHFPTIFDKREKFQLRGDYIKEVIFKLTFKYAFLHSIFLEDKFVFKSENINDDHPYHYGNKTYEYFLNEVKKIISS